MTTTKRPQFYLRPEMLGHIVAKESYDLALEIESKFVKTAKQRKLFNSVVHMGCDDWHVWYQDYNKKYLTQVRYCLRHIESITPYGLYSHIEQGHAMLKSDLLRYLELRAYVYDRKDFLRDYCHTFGSLGMDNKEATERCEKYMVSLKTRYEYQI